MAEVFLGSVKWFNETKGFGFITPADDSGDIYVHSSEIRNVFKTLKEGQNVRFEIQITEKGRIAANVRTDELLIQ